MSAAIASELYTWLRSREQEMADFLVRLATAETPSTVPAAHGPALDLLESQLGALEFQVRKIAGRRTAGALYARPTTRRRGAPFQLLIGHEDTVWPIGSVEELGVAIDDGVVRGPGTLDMKGGLVEIVFALRALAEHGLEPEVTPVIVVNSDEEIGSFESQALLERLSRCAARAYILEPAHGPSGRLKTGRKSAGHFTVVVRGRAAHAGVNPEEGVSAILELSHQIQRLFDLNDATRGITVNVGMIDGGLGANVVAAEASAEVDVRVPTLGDARAVESAIHALEPVGEGLTLEVTGRFGRLPLEPTPRNQALWLAAQAAGRKLGLELEEAFVGGASDGNTTSLHTATLDGLGPVGEGAHAPNEHVRLASLPERAALLALLILLPAEVGR